MGKGVGKDMERGRGTVGVKDMASGLSVPYVGLRMGKG